MRQRVPEKRIPVACYGESQVQKRVGELETAAGRVEELEKRIRERDHEIGRLRQALVDRESLASRVTALTQERAQLMTEIQKQQETIKAHKEQPEIKDCAPAAPNSGTNRQAN